MLFKHLFLQIKVIHDLPGVGQNLQDHPAVFGLTWTVEKGKGTSFFKLFGPKSAFKFMFHKNGLCFKFFDTI